MTGPDNSALGRHLRILEAVAGEREGLTLSEIARETGVPTGTVHRLVGASSALGLLRRDAGTRRHLPGARLLALFHAAASATDHTSVARPILDGLVRDFGETAHLARLNGSSAESILMEQPAGEARAFVRPGRQLPLHAAASGKAILAHQDEAYLRSFFAVPRQRFTERTRIAEAEIRQELEGIRRAGMARCDNELDAGVLSYGMPIRVDGERVISSVGITGISERLRRIDPERIRQKLARAATDLARVAWLTS